MFSKIFYNKKILITGHTGFKGSWMISWLKKLKPKKIIGIASNLPTRPSHYQSGLMSKLINNNKINLVEFKKMEKVFIKEQPDFVFHMAANALVRDSYTNPMKTWQSNLMGTVNILECLRKVKKKCIVVMVTSDKSYEKVKPKLFEILENILSFEKKISIFLRKNKFSFYLKKK